MTGAFGEFLLYTEGRYGEKLTSTYISLRRNGSTLQIKVELFWPPTRLEHGKTNLGNVKAG
jgi:hypothetical protein